MQKFFVSLCAVVSHLIPFSATAAIDSSAVSKLNRAEAAAASAVKLTPSNSAGAKSARVSSIDAINSQGLPGSGSPRAIELGAPNEPFQYPNPSASADAANASLPGAFSVVLDPGHGGRDHGATHGNLKESEIALKVALKLEKLLETDPKFRVSMTRMTDQTLSLEERTLFAKRERADLYLSIHLNSSTDSRAHGKEFYFQNQLPVDEDSMFLASRENNSATPEPGTHEPRGEMTKTAGDAVSKRGDVRNIIDDLKRNERIHSSSLLSQILCETWGMPSRTVSGRMRQNGSRAIRQAPFFVIANADAPAALVELGFITHPSEGPKMAIGSYQDELAQSLYDGIVKFRSQYTGEIANNSPDSL